MSVLGLFIVSVFTPLLFSHSIHGWLFEEEHKPRDLDGSLRCYQCNTSEEDSGPGHLPICSLNNWKHANITEKRNMIMQCPRRKSAFCHLIIKEGSDHTIRGCSGPNYTTGDTAHVGCFSMVSRDFVNRVCLCDTDLCNVSNRVVLKLYWLVLLIMLWVKVTN